MTDLTNDQVDTLNQEAEELKDSRNEKCEPLVPIILNIIAKANIIPKEEMTHEEEQAVFGPVQVEINKLFMEKNLTIPEVNYTFSIVQGVMDIVKSYSLNSIQFAYNIAEQKAWGVDNIKDISLQKIESMLQ